MQLGQRFASGVGWNVIGAVFNQGSTFVLGIIVANALGRQQYGIYGFLQSTIALFTSMGYLATGFVATKFVAEYRAIQKERAGRIILTCLAVATTSGILAALIATGAAPLIAARVVNRPEIAPLIRIAAPAILFAIVTASCNGALVGFENFRRNALGGALSGSAYLAIGALMAQRGTVAAVLSGIVVSAALQSVIMIALVRYEAGRQGVPLRLSSLREIGAERSTLLHVALPAALSSFSILPAQWLAISFLARRPGGIDQVAIFTAAQALRTMAMFLPFLINSVGFSVISNYRGASDLHGYRRAFWMNLTAVGSVATAGAAFIALAGPLLLRAYGKSFTDGYPVLLIMVGSTIAEALAIASFQVVQTRGHIWTSLFFVGLPRDISIVLLAIPLTKHYGAVGLATAFLCGALIMLLSIVHLVRRLGIAPHAATTGEA
jgi:O-antigen/teichoic acid export membrane protein